MTWKNFLDELAAWLEQRDLLDPHQRWVLGVSGGSDSTLLAHAMSDLSKERDLDLRLSLAHLHHGLRGDEADADETFVRDLAAQLGATFYHERVDVPAAVAKSGGNTEDVARQTRYEFLERTALMAGSDRVAVAHHADDDAETIFHRICRGTGLRGLAGIADCRPISVGSRVRLVRPLIHQFRETIEKLLTERGLHARQDSTNAGGVYTRGKIRNEIFPLLREKVNPGIRESLLRLAEQARWLGNYLEDAAARTIDSLVVFEGPQRLVLNVNALLGKQKIIQAEVVRLACSLTVGGDVDLGFAHVDSVLKLAAERASGKEVHLPGRVIVRKQYDRLEFKLADKEPQPDLTPVFANCPGSTHLPLLKAELSINEELVDAGKIEELRRAPAPYEEWLDLERVLPPLFVRGRQAGDRFHPLGAPGAKRLSDFFIDEKIDPLERARTGVLCDQLGPIWIMPLRIDERVKLRPTSQRALHCVFRPLKAPPFAHQ